jgi:hyperosmotically inducible protein
MKIRPWITLVLLTAAVMSLPIAAQANTRPDAWITLKAKTALYIADDVSGTAINVDTINGRVTLAGKVHSDTERAKAVEIVKKIDGVLDVRNLLQIVPPGKEAKVQRSDDLIKADLDKRLTADHSLDNSSISVKSVNKGVVLMHGKAASLDDNERALYYAVMTPGVIRVASEIEVNDMIADDDFRTDNPATRSTSTVISDLWITSATKMKLAMDSRTPATEINVDTNSGVVNLFGMVPSADSKAAAGDIARGVSGVTRVENEIEVVSPGMHDMIQARDDEIRVGVNKALADRGEQENADISVEVKNGVVRLTGRVPTWQRNLSAVYAARSVEGVRSVRNDMTVEPPIVAAN